MQYYFIIKIYFCQITVWFTCFLLNFVRLKHAERSNREKFSGNSNGRYVFTGIAGKATDSKKTGGFDCGKQAFIL